MVSVDRLAGRLGNQMFQLAFIYSKFWRGEIPDIYLQYPSYFDDCREKILELFGGGISGSRPEVSVHVRRGDYVKDPAFVHLWKTDYYQRAAELFPGREFLVFSDDPEWCKKNLPWKVVEGQTDLEDMNLMASCHSNIIANSSFSWWAAYLNRNPEKKVIYPKHWHSDGVVRVGFPSDWIAL
jgi:hypothetical protein